MEEKNYITIIVGLIKFIIFINHAIYIYIIECKKCKKYNKSNQK